MSKVRCAIYTRKSCEEGLDQEFNSLDAQYEACKAYIASQKHEGWTVGRDRYDDGGFSGGSMERPGLKALLADVAAGKIDVVVIYKIDRLTRSLADFARIVELLEKHGASFVSVTQGNIIVVGAGTASRGRPGTLGFAAAKAAQRSICQSLARQLGPEGIHVAFLILDGVVDIPSTMQRMADCESACNNDPGFGVIGVQN